jgi:hypothetical protein
MTARSSLSAPAIAFAASLFHMTTHSIAVVDHEKDLLHARPHRHCEAEVVEQ